MTVSYFARDVYGRMLLYPTGPGSELVCALISGKTISKHQIEQFEKLGVSFSRVDDPRHDKV